MRIRNILISLSTTLFLLGLWQLICVLSLVPEFILPTPVAVIHAFIDDFPLIFENAKTSMTETLLGLIVSILLAYFTVIVMDRFLFLESVLLPIITFTQTIPTIAIAPLLVLWMGFGITPKVVLIIIVCYFPLVMGLLSGFKAVGKEYKILSDSLQLSSLKVLFSIKIRGTFKEFFVGLKIAISYAVVGAIIAEWLGGESGLGVYMMRVRKAYAYDKMFAVIFLVSALSLVLLAVVKVIEKVVLRYENK